MALDTSLIDQDVVNIIADLPSTMTFSGSNYTVRRNILNRSDITEDNGLRERYLFSVYLRTADFGTQPDIDDEVIIDGVTLLVLDTAMMPATKCLRLDLGEERAL